MSDEEEDPFQILIATIVLFGSCLLGICANSWSIRVVTRNMKVNPAIGILFTIDSIARILHCSIAVFYTTPCAFTYFCARYEEGWTFGLLTNRIMGYLKFVLVYSTHLIAFALSVNRFFAVFREGRYYKWTTTKIHVQVVVIVLIPLAVLCPFLLPEQYNYYDPLSFGWWVEGDIASFVLDHFYHNSIIVIWITVIVLDVFTAVNVRLRMGRSGNLTFRRVDIQIMKQVFSFHIIELLYYIVYRVLDILQNDPTFRWSDMGNFLFYDFTLAVIDNSAGLSRVYYLRSSRPSKQPLNSSMAKSLSAAEPPVIVEVKRKTKSAGLTRIA